MTDPDWTHLMTLLAAQRAAHALLGRNLPELSREAVERQIERHRQELDAKAADCRVAVLLDEIADDHLTF